MIYMCYYITATLPKDTKLEHLQQIVDDYKMGFTPIDNNHIKSQLRPQELYLRATKDYCDCDSVVGTSSTSHIYESLINSKKVKKLRKKKWTEDMIENWIAEKIKNKNNDTGKNWPQFREKEATRWIKFLRDMLDIGKNSHIGILKHWYKGGLDSEQFAIKEKKRIKIDLVNTDFLLKLDEDILYEFFIPFSRKH